MMTKSIHCCQCNKSVDANFVTGETIYPHRPDLFSKSFYQCPHCLEYVGTHKGTDTPLGSIPTKELRMARIWVHGEIDPLWKMGRIKRSTLYGLIAKELGIKRYHTGNIRTTDEAIRVVNFTNSLFAEQ